MGHFQGFWDLRRAKKQPQIGLKLDLFHLFVHPMWCTISSRMILHTGCYGRNYKCDSWSAWSMFFMKDVPGVVRR